MKGGYLNMSSQLIQLLKRLETQTPFALVIRCIQWLQYPGVERCLTSLHTNTVNAVTTRNPIAILETLYSLFTDIGQFLCNELRNSNILRTDA
ncbi:hypothetical protein CEXT_790691 [Caerostris extrusa]|uniref:Uncharacterized protein n=1 Tax=Caerostris extrusa TaxID=172846 RepID=A0AAV4VV91_CAEEX|nr:hypothetical protein CEXT_790691 [Caerostris extrusa]